LLADVHLRSFPGFFLSSLGPRFLSLFYERLITSAEVVVVAIADSRLTGFAAGSTSPSGLFKRLIRRDAHRFALASLPAFLRSPRIGPRLVRALLKPSEAATRPPGAATLLSICVERESRGTGTAQSLLEAFVAEVRRRGAGTLDLTTDRDENHVVNRFYQRNGFSLQREFVTPEGRRMNEYVLKI
jgi:ribosomal protein S18 acetylase RimI-like enzyme